MIGAMTHPPPPPEWLASEYGLRGAVVATLGTCDPDAPVWRCECDGNAYVIKQIREKYTDRSLDLGCAAQELVAACAGLSPVPFRSLSGSLWVRLGEQRFVLSELWPGRALDHREMTACGIEAIGLLLGRIHRVLAMLFHPVEDGGFLYLANGSPCMARPLTDTLRACAVDSEIQCFQTRTYELRTTVGPDLHEAFDTLEMQWIHGDVRPRNLLTCKQRLCLVDYDQVSRFPRVYEVMRAFVKCSPRTLDPSAQGRWLERYLKAYTQEHPVRGRDLALMLDFYRWVLLSETRTFEEAVRGIAGAREHLRERMDTVEWLERTLIHLRGAVERAAGIGSNARDNSAVKM